ncbi:hypothetical protein [Alkalinema sp. FACHB-956]|uniref:hypothetical protein n=1 Tax=Alkalinema sp. FACHB-956 TaxID=2692768 RepID=UPI00168702F7|nr:hypothetical protein [Alkalinema sp. FACHB-956]MBD2329945.1 hypothetical protein [Alkalinema sp. FACHB-956]
MRHSIFAISCLTLSTLLTGGLTTGGLAQPSTVPAARSGLSDEIGWEFVGESTLNSTQIVETEYVGDCPGSEIETKEARFTSSKTPTGDRRRVLVRNTTRGLTGDTMPFTNREYDKGRSSEATKMEFGTSHSSKRLRVLPGVNEFDYEIRERDRVIDSGKFSANIEKATRQITRNAQWYNEEVCANSSVSNNVCADLRQRRQFRCSTGKVLQSYFESDDSPSYRTLISNQTNKSIRLSIDGDLYRLESGESVRVRRRSSFEVRYNPTCQTCELTHSNYVEAGKRVKFRQQNSRIELVDYPRDDY